MLQSAESLSVEAKTEIIEKLNQVVAETVVTTMLAQNFHWNVTGMGFGSLHALFQEIYEDHFEGQDDVAERIKAIGGHAEGQLAGMLKRSKVGEQDGHQSDKEMIKFLSDAQKTIADTIAGTAAYAEEAGDVATHDLMIERQQIHEKFAWMLDAHLR
ncbi:MAG: DNA starvation/stationary phase protection protein [Pseudomonadota bacterium]